MQALGGNLDERFGVGFFDDDDLCFRAREKGFRLAIAQDVFIHHFGNRTFAGLGLDTRGLLQENFERFRDKWGAERTAGYRLPESEREGTEGTEREKAEFGGVSIAGI